MIYYVMVMFKYSSVFYLEFQTKFTTSKNYRWDYALREQIPKSLFRMNTFKNLFCYKPWLIVVFFFMMYKKKNIRFAI